MAESQGFEPRVPAKAQRFSRPPHSTALPTLHEENVILSKTPFHVNAIHYITMIYTIDFY